MFKPSSPDAGIMVTGVAGFIGFQLAETLLKHKLRVVGIDNMCEVYYSANLKQARLQVLKAYPNFEFHQVDLCEFEPVQRVWEGSNCQYIVHLAAHASVLPSFDEPFKYVYNNALSTQVVLELARRTENLKHLVYASTSSVYGRSFSKEPVKESEATHTPVSVYGASKVGNEAMAQAYADSFGTPVTGLRFFKVYGPWGRPDTVFFKFAHRIYNDRPVDVHNFGDIFHSFTYIDDIIGGVLAALSKPPVIEPNKRHPIYNLGNPQSLSLIYCLDLIEELLGKKATRRLVPLPLGDRSFTHANVELAAKELGYTIKTPVETGLKRFIDWYKAVYVPLRIDHAELPDIDKGRVT